MTVTAAAVPVASLGVLPLAVGAAVALALRGFGVPAEVKWPNDILIGDRKVCGILCESSLLGSSARVFVGIGINVEASSVGEGLSKLATSLETHGAATNRPAVAAGVLARLVPILRGRISATEVIPRWKELAVPWWGRPIHFIEGAAERRMTLLDVNPLGQLVARDESGTLRSFVSGEIREIRSAGA